MSKLEELLIGVGTAAAEIATQRHQTYLRPHYGFITDHTGTFFPVVGLTCLLNFIRREDDEVLRKNYWFNPAISTALCVYSEVLQKFHAWPGTFDMLDIYSALAGGLVGLALSKRSAQKELNEITSKPCQSQQTTGTSQALPG